MGKRIYPLSRIKKSHAYDLEEIAELYGDKTLHVQTVRTWIRAGLPLIDKKRPALVFGYDLWVHLGKMNKSNKCMTQDHEMFCMKCRDARPPLGRGVKLESFKGFIRAKAICKSCKTIMNKSYKLQDYPKLKRLFTVVEVLELYDSAYSTVNTHLDVPTQIPLSESQQMELFQ